MARRARPWRCRSCLTINPVRTRKCGACSRPRPKRRRAAHNAALDIPYDAYVELNGGDFCFLCEKTREENGGKKFHREHDHDTGMPRGLACFPCNVLMRKRVTLAWAKRLVLFLERAQQIAASFTADITNQTEETTTDGTQEP